MPEKLYYKKGDVLLPTLDVVFQSLFGEVGSEKITARFLSTILKEKIEEVDLSLNPVIRREKVDDKLGILDVIAKINEKEMCNIEMQLVYKPALFERLLHYWGKTYSKQIKSRR